MRVALLVPSISVGGAVETPSVRLFAETIAEAADVEVFALRYPPEAGETVVGNLRVRAVGGSDRRFARQAVATVRAVATAHERRPFDLLHALWLHEPGTVAMLAGRLLRVPVIASIGGAEVVSLPDIGYGALRTARGRLMTANVLQRATLVTGGSTYVVNRGRRMVPHRPAQRFRLAPLPVDTDHFRPASSAGAYDPSAPRLLHAGSLIPVKDQSTLLRVFRLVVDDIPGARLTIAGEDPFGLQSELTRLRDGLGLTDVVSFIGAVPHARMAALYRESDLFVLTSRHESQGMVVLEAAACGVPTIGTAVGVVPDLAPAASVAVRPGSDVELASEIVDTLRSPDRLRSLGQAARRRAVEAYGRDAATRRFMRLYDEVVDRGIR